jgi:hypothetical protein
LPKRRVTPFSCNQDILERVRFVGLDFGRYAAFGLG